jgi:hypothetical protein
MIPTFEQLLRALRASWAADTSFAAKEWSAANPARGQCVASSLVIQHYLGGDLVRYRVLESDTTTIREAHYCNMLPDGTKIDATASQYNEPVILREDPVRQDAYASPREKRLADPVTKQHYELLLKRVEAYIHNNAA